MNCRPRQLCKCNRTWPQELACQKHWVKPYTDEAEAVEMEDVGDGVVEDARKVVDDDGDAMCEANRASGSMTITAPLRYTTPFELFLI